MTSNYKKRLQTKWAKDVEASISTTKRLWELSTLLALHRQFGFGEKRLLEFSKCLNEIYSEFEQRAKVTDPYDKAKREYSDIDTAIIKVVKELRACGIDHRKVLGDNEQLIIVNEDGTQTNIDDFLDKIEGLENPGGNQNG